MERRPGSNEPARRADQAPESFDEDTPLEARDSEETGEVEDSVQGWEEDEPTEPEQAADDGYHPDNGGPEYEQPDPVDEPLLAREEGLTPDGEEDLNV